jgi:hypothetical protein
MGDARLQERQICSWSKQFSRASCLVKILGGTRPPKLELELIWDGLLVSETGINVGWKLRDIANRKPQLQSCARRRQLKLQIL